MFLLAVTTLVVEVLLTRIFDVLLWPNLSFLVISCALFGLSLGGLFDLVTASRQSDESPLGGAAAPAAAFGLSVWLLPVLLNAIPFGFTRIADAPLAQISWFLLLYIVLLAPFFLAGLAICRVFSRRVAEVHRLYFWDLSGAAVGTGLLIPLLPRLGPERILMIAGVCGLAASALLGGLSPRRLFVAGAAFLIAPFALGHRYLVLDMHDNKRDVQAAIDQRRLEFSIWDPVSQIAVIDEPARSGSPWDLGRKHVAYDGGTQSTNFSPFDGDFTALRRDLAHRLKRHFWQRGVLASHYLRRDTGHTALVIGSAGGQETKAALLYGASHVDAIEMVGAVVRLATGPYAGYIGHLFENPAVSLRVGEGRSFLRASTTRYDVIQIFSNYTSSSVAEGSGAVMPVYLQTTEAYEEYFAHLKADGILHVNRYAYPRMIATAAAAWRSSGRGRFRPHVAVFERSDSQPDPLPTVLIKMSPWTPSELDDLVRFFAQPVDGDPPYRLVENPLDAASSALPDAFYAGQLPPDLVKRAPYNVDIVTDDRPYFNLLQRSPRHVDPNPRFGLDGSTAAFINSRIRAGWIPMDWLHLILASVASIFYGIAFVLVPLSVTDVGQQKWAGKAAALTYFSLLGFAFITIELVLIQVFIKLVGYPLYAVATVITVMLIAAALGSASTARISRVRAFGPHAPFAAIVVTGLAVWFAYPFVFGLLIGAPIAIRMLAAAAMIFPMAFFMGMPFPIGFATLKSMPRGAIAWAWSMNGLFTTIGGVGTALLSFEFGFRGTLLIAFFAYAVAGVVLVAVKRSSAVQAGISQDVTMPRAFGSSRFRDGRGAMSA